MNCHGNGADHCCYISSYGVCQYLEENTVEGRRWACGLFREFGSWDAVHSSEAYLANVKPKLDAVGNPDCGEWPQAVLNTEGAGGLCCWQTEVSLGDLG